MKKETVKSLRKLNQLHSYTTVQMHEAIGRKAGLPGTDHKYLGFLMESGQMTAGELAVLSGLTTGAVTGLINRFEEKNLVKRQFDKSDRRKVFIVPNKEQIMKLFVPLYHDYRSKTEKLIASFSENEIRAIEKYLSKAIGIMNGTTDNFSKKK
jgi:DNA-binding MarR family transcriptional regulator